MYEKVLNFTYDNKNYNYHYTKVTFITHQTRKYQKFV